MIHSPSKSDGKQGSPRDHLIARIVELAPAMRRAIEVRPGAEERAEWLALTGHQLEALSALDAGSLTMGELCDHLDISESAGTALCDRLVGRGMVERLQEPSDRRVVRLALTDEATVMTERYRAAKRARVTQLLSVLDREDLSHLVRIYEAILSGQQDKSAKKLDEARLRQGKVKV